MIMVIESNDLTPGFRTNSWHDLGIHTAPYSDLYIWCREDAMPLPEDGEEKNVRKELR